MFCSMRHRFIVIVQFIWSWGTSSYFNNLKRTLKLWRKESKYYEKTFTTKIIFCYENYMLTWKLCIQIRLQKYFKMLSEQKENILGMVWLSIWKEEYNFSHVCRSLFRFSSILPFPELFKIRICKISIRFLEIYVDNVNLYI